MISRLFYHRNHLAHKSGFTLIELLIVLWFISILILLITPPLLKQKQQFEVAQFFKVLESDVLYIQQKALHGEFYKLYFQDNQYIVAKSSVIIKKRVYPSPLKLKGRNETVITYTINGNISKPITYLFSNKDEDISIVFPLGRGRFYFKE